MAKSKKTREQKLRERQAKDRRRDARAEVEMRMAKLNLHREVDYIVARAQAADGRFVSLANLFFFSTHTGDAWILDTEDHFAACLCRNGVRQPFRIIDFPETYAIDWLARFQVEGDTFFVRNREGESFAIDGYPIREISAACQRARRDQGSAE